MYKGQKLIDLRILQRVQRIVEQSLAGKGVTVIWR